MMASEWARAGSMRLGQDCPRGGLTETAKTFTNVCTPLLVSGAIFFRPRQCLGYRLADFNARTTNMQVATNTK